MYKKTNKIVASIIVFMMLLTHVSVIGTHAGEVFANTDVNNQNTKTNHSNVEFDVYFVEGEKPVYLCQKDIRQIQLAKSSIYSGCLTVLKEAGMESEEVDCLFLAGAFGNYIDIDHALSIGLLPPVPREKIVSVGNGAGDGVQTLLMDQSYREKLKIISDHCIHVELANHPLFMEEYIKNMNFDFA